MFIQLFLICILRYATECIVDTYNGEALYCNVLLQKAKQTQEESIRNAYCVEVLDADQKAVLNTLKQYHLSFLASNQTYSTFDEVLNYSCKIPYSLELFLQWTSGLVPLAVAFLIYKIVEYVRVKFQNKMKQRTVVHVKKAEQKKEDDGPPIFKSKTVREHMYTQDRPISRIKTPEVIKKKHLSSTTEALVTNLTPNLRQRILGTTEATEV